MELVLAVNAEYKLPLVVEELLIGRDEGLIRQIQWYPWSLYQVPKHAPHVPHDITTLTGTHEIRAHTHM